MGQDVGIRAKQRDRKGNLGGWICGRNLFRKELFSLGEHYTAFSFFLRVWKRDGKHVCYCSLTDTLGAPEDSLVPTQTGQVEFRVQVMPSTS